jgi:hypothetical protein
MYFTVNEKAIGTPSVSKIQEPESRRKMVRGEGVKKENRTRQKKGG